jgi:hypothetical protein
VAFSVAVKKSENVMPQSSERQQHICKRCKMQARMEIKSKCGKNKSLDFAGIL